MLELIIKESWGFPSKNSKSKHKKSPSHACISNKEVWVAVPVRFSKPIGFGVGLKFVVQLIISKVKSCFTEPTKFPFESNSSIRTTTTKLPWIVGVNVISPVLEFILIPLIGLEPE